MSIGQTIRQVREQKSLSLRALARLSEMDLKNLWSIETGVIKSPRIGTLQQIAKGLGVPVSDLMSEPAHEAG